MGTAEENGKRKMERVGIAVNMNSETCRFYNAATTLPLLFIW